MTHAHPQTTVILSEAHSAHSQTTVILSEARSAQSKDPDEGCIASTLDTILPTDSPSLQPLRSS